MNVAIHSQGVTLTDALCLHISGQLQLGTGEAAALVEQATLDLTVGAEHGHDTHVQCHLAMSIRPCTTINLTISAPTPGAAIAQATDLLRRVVPSPGHLSAAPAVQLPTVTRIPAAMLFRRCARTAR